MNKETHVAGDADKNWDIDEDIDIDLPEPIT